MKLQETDYVVAAGFEKTPVFDNDGHPFGIKVLVAMNRELSDADRNFIRRKVDEIEQALELETARLDPVQIEFRELERRQIVLLFPPGVYVEEIPNRYWPAGHPYSLNPWFVVTTIFGRVMIGWRKRVISISWEGADLRDKADALFPTEDVTRIGRLIHAYGYEKALEYITRLYNAYYIQKQRDAQS